MGARSTVLAGTVCATAAYVGLAVWHDSSAQVAGALVLLGAGLGLSLAAIATLVVASVEPPRTSGAIGVNALARIIGSAVGAQIAAALITPAAGVPVPADSDFQSAFLLGAVASAVAALLALLLPSSRRDPVLSLDASAPPEGRLSPG